MKHRFKHLVTLLAKSPNSSSASQGNIDEEIRFAVAADMAMAGRTRLNPHVWNRVLRNQRMSEWRDMGVMLVRSGSA